MDAKTIDYLVENKSQRYLQMSDMIWEFAEIRFREYRSSALLCEQLEAEGFAITRGVAGIDTAFVAEYGSGSPKIGFLGEFDALRNLSQKSGQAVRESLGSEANGHGCGHHALGVAALAAAVAVKDAMQDGAFSGTVRFFGCPGEEVGHGKTFLLRDNVFDGTDAMITWHPGDTNGVLTASTLAVKFVLYTFHGVSAHASGDPHLGRSALDAVELMNVGANFLREHIIQEARLHYAILDAGGASPNIVQSRAQVLYEVRAPKSSQVQNICERIEDIAKGAALMTGTSFESQKKGGMSNCIVNQTMCGVMQKCMLELGVQKNDEEDFEFAGEIARTLSADDKESALIGTELPLGLKDRARLKEKLIADVIVDYNPDDGRSVKISTDVGDVSWNFPTVQCVTACETFGTPGHSWQIVAQGKSGIFHKGMIFAAKTMAFTAAELFQNPKLVGKAKTELLEKRGGEDYISPIQAGDLPDVPV
jgi:aminobenzoyl-glutamate utilization protein B